MTTPPDDLHPDIGAAFWQVMPPDAEATAPWPA
jgi:hypothetical protein